MSKPVRAWIIESDKVREIEVVRAGEVAVRLPSRYGRITRATVYPSRQKGRKP